MPYDEYEISLSRELTVCKNTIKRIKETLALMERAHHMSTEEFMKTFEQGALTDKKDDYEAWRVNYESLKRWKALEQQYQEAFRMMKI